MLEMIAKTWYPKQETIQIWVKAASLDVIDLREIDILKRKIIKAFSLSFLKIQGSRE